MLTPVHISVESTHCEITLQVKKQQHLSKVEVEEQHLPHRLIILKTVSSSIIQQLLKPCLGKFVYLGCFQGICKVN